MNTHIIQFNDISIVLNWIDENLQVYVTYIKNGQQIMDTNIFGSLEKIQIQSLVNNYCHFYDLHLYSF